MKVIHSFIVKSIWSEYFIIFVSFSKSLGHFGVHFNLSLHDYHVLSLTLLFQSKYSHDNAYNLQYNIQYDSHSCFGFVRCSYGRNKLAIKNILCGWAIFRQTNLDVLWNLPFFFFSFLVFWPFISVSQIVCERIFYCIFCLLSIRSSDTLQNSNYDSPYTHHILNAVLTRFFFAIAQPCV